MDESSSPIRPSGPPPIPPSQTLPGQEKAEKSVEVTIIRESDSVDLSKIARAPVSIAGQLGLSLISAPKTVTKLLEVGFVFPPPTKEIPKDKPMPETEPLKIPNLPEKRESEPIDPLEKPVKSDSTDQDINL